MELQAGLKLALSTHGVHQAAENVFRHQESDLRPPANPELVRPYAPELVVELAKRSISG